MFSKNKFIILLKTALALLVFSVPIHFFILNIYNSNFSRYLAYELKLQKYLHPHDENNLINISNAKQFVVSSSSDLLFHDENLFFLHKYFKKKQLDVILLEVALDDNFTKALKIKDKWIIITILHEKNSHNYHVSIKRSEALNELEDHVNTLIYMLYSIALILGVSIYILLSSKEKINRQKDKIKEAFNESNLYFENDLIGFLTVDNDRIILNVNQVMCEMLGYTKKELIGESASIIHISQESFLNFGKKAFEQAKEKIIINIRYQFKRKDDSFIWIEISGAPFDLHKKFKKDGVVWTVKDISDQVYNEYIIKNLNKSLRDNLKYLQNFLDVVPIPIFVKNEDGYLMECNSAFSKLIKLKKKNIVNKRIENVVPEFSSMLHLSKDEELLYKDAVNYKDIFVIDSNNVSIYEFHKTVIKNNEKYNGYICVMLDITKREEQENILQKRITDALEKNKILLLNHEKEKLKDVKFKAIGQLTAGITHEINTPLTYLKGNLEMIVMDLQEIPETCEQKKLLLESAVEMEDGLSRLSNIVDSMKEMSRKSNYELKKTNIYATLITSLIVSYNHSKQISNIYINDELFTINIKKDKYEYFVLAQYQRIEQVWLIIINNALDELSKFKTFIQREIRINCFKENDKLIVRFSDNAGGIDESIIKDIFEPFISNKPEGGMGIGLSVAKKIIEDNNATIKVYNDGDKAVFEVSFEYLEY